MYLGDVIAETLEKDFRVITDREANEYLQMVGNKLVKHLPPTNLKFTFHIIDTPQLNAFATAGGRIYVTRKMVAFLRNESELAGILGHELGHAVVRHVSADLSLHFKKILKVESVGGRDDIYAKYNDLIDNRNTKRVKTSGGHENDQQLEADKIGVFSMVAAGYDPKGFAAAWNRLTETKGKTGNSFSDFFGTTKPAEKRLREILRAIESLPRECVDKNSSTSNAGFEKWQSYIVSSSSFAKEEKLPHLISQSSLKPYLRGDIIHFQFSPDGKYILAQDSSGVNVLTREPFKFLFRINISDAKFANFSPDSKFVTLQTYGLRVEKWSIETQQPTLAREVFVRGRCWQSTLSPDGETLICYSSRTHLEIIDVETNDTIIRKEKFYEPSFFEYFAWIFKLSEYDDKEIDAMQMEFSPDGKYFLGGRVFRFSTGGFMSYGSWGINLNQDALIAFDLHEKEEIKIRGELKNIVSMPFAFYSNDKIIGQHRKNPEKSGIFTFPEGKQVERFFMKANSYTKPHSGDFLLVRPTTTNPVGVFDIKAQKFIASNKTPALDVYGEYSVSESKDGVISLHKFDTAAKKLELVNEVALPKNNLGDVRAVSISPDFDWLALSEKSRGGVWNLKNGEIKIYIRGFRGAYFDQSGFIYSDFPKFENQERSIGVMNPATNQAGILEPIESVKSKLKGRYLIRLKTKEDEKIEKEREKRAQKGEDVPPESEEEAKKVPEFRIDSGFLVGIDLSLGFAYREGDLEIHDAVTRKMLWTKNFPDEVPKFELNPDSETVSLFWNVNAKAAKNEIKNDPLLREKLKSLGEKEGDYLIQILDANTGKIIGQNLIETGEGSFGIAGVSASGDWLTILDSENRVQIYSLSKGELVWRFFGHKAWINPAKSVALVENIEGQLSIYSLNDGKKIDKLLFTSPVIYVKFSRDGNKLFVLTGNQNYYVFNIDGLTKPKPA